MQLYAKINNPLVVRNREALLKELSKSKAYADVRNKIIAADAEYKQKTDATVKESLDYLIDYRKKNPDAPKAEIYNDPQFDTLFNAEDAIIAEWTETVDNLARQAKTEITKYLKDNGYDGVILENDVGSFGRSTKTIIALENTQVKSVNNNIGTFDESNADIRYSIKEEIDSYNLGSLNDYIGVQKRVLKQLDSENFFSDNGERIVYNKSFGRNIVINKSGIRETLGKGNRFETLPSKLKLLKLATIRQLPQIIESAVVYKVNEANYHRNSSDLSYSYLKATVNIDGEQYDVIIDIRESISKDKFWMHRIYEINKNEQPFGVDESKDSEATLSKVTAHDATIPQSKNDVKGKFSLQENQELIEAHDELLKENNKLKKANLILKEQLTLTNGHTMSKTAEDKIGRYIDKLLKENRIDDTKAAEIKERIMNIFRYLSDDYADITSALDAMVVVCEDIAKESYVEMYDGLDDVRDMVKDLRRDIRNVKIHLNEEQYKHLVEEYGSLTKAKKAFYSGFDIVKNPTTDSKNIDILWSELIDKYAGLFSESGYAIAPAEYDMETGKITRETIGHYETRSEALEALAAYNQAPTKKIRSTFADLYQEWKSASFKKLSKSMQDCYSAAYKKLYPIHGSIFKDIRTADMQQIINYYEDEHYELENGRKVLDKSGKPKIRDPLSYSSLHHITVLLGLIYGYAMQNDVVNKDYSKFVVISIDKSPEKQAFSDLEVHKMEEAAKAGEPYADWILIMCYTGYRIGEFLGLTQFNYNPDEEVFSGGGNKTEAGRNKIVPIHPKIRAYVQRQADINGKTIFCKEDGTPFRADTFRRDIYYQTLETIGVRPLTPHATRRTFATRAAAAGVRHEDIIRMMGHTDYKVDVDSYIKQEAHTLVSAISKIG